LKLAGCTCNRPTQTFKLAGCRCIRPTQTFTLTGCSCIRPTQTLTLAGCSCIRPTQTLTLAGCSCIRPTLRVKPGYCIVTASVTFGCLTYLTLSRVTASRCTDQRNLQQLNMLPTVDPGLIFIKPLKQKGSRRYFRGRGVRMRKTGIYPKEETYSARTRSLLFAISATPPRISMN